MFDLLQNVNMEHKMFLNVLLAQRLFLRFGTKVVPKCQSDNLAQWLFSHVHLFGTMIVQNAYLAQTLFQINDLVQKLF